MHSLGWILVAVVLAKSPEPTMPVRVQILPTPEAVRLATGATPGPVFELTFSSDSGEELGYELPAAGARDVDLTAGSWRVRLSAPSQFWSPSRELTLRAGSTQETLTLPIYPASELAVRLRWSEELSEDPPGELHLRFNDHHHPKQLSEESTCDVEDGVARCGVPSGDLDLRLRAASFLSDYHWGTRFDPGETTVLEYVPVPGAALVGRVEIGEGAEPLRALVTARLTTAEPSHADDPRGSSVHETAAVNEHGFFHFRGLRPGNYRITVEQEGFGPVSTDVSVAERSETALFDPPLVLWKPRPLEVAVEPTADPYGRPWQLRVDRLDPVAQRAVEALADETVDELGAWSRDSVPVGKYALRLSDSQGNLWVAEKHELTPFSDPVFIVVSVLPVIGTVALGDEPLSAEVTFGNQRTPGIVMHSDEDGEFEGYLTGEGEWAIRVTGDGIRQGLTAEVAKREGRAEAFVDLKLPDTRIQGRVVREDGTPPERPVVQAFSAGNLRAPTWQRLEEDDEGEFVLRALPVGRLELSATARGDNGGILESETIAIDLQDGVPVEGLRLTVREQMSLRGTVRSADGPLPMVQVGIHPLDGLTAGLYRNTGMGGVFEADLRKGTPAVALNVLPPGFAAQAFRHDLSSDAELLVVATHEGGTLVLSGLPDRHHWALFNERGGYWTALDLKTWVELASGETTPTGWTVPGMEATAYRLCEVEDGDWAGIAATGTLTSSRAPCVEGFLPPSGRLELALDEDRQD